MMHHRVFQVFLRKKEGFELLLVLSTATGALAFNNNLNAIKFKVSVKLNLILRIL